MDLSFYARHFNFKIGQKLSLLCYGNGYINFLKIEQAWFILHLLYVHHLNFVNNFSRLPRNPRKSKLSNSLTTRNYRKTKGLKVTVTVIWNLPIMWFGLLNEQLESYATPFSIWVLKLSFKTLRWVINYDKIL